MRLLPAVRSALLDHAAADLPREACGLLAIDGEGNICAAFATPNSAVESAEFLIAPADFQRALVAAESAGWTIGGVYHSHPEGGSAPSAADVDGGVDSRWIYLIVTCRGGVCDDVRAYRIAAGGVEAVVVEGCGSRRRL